MAMRKLYEKNEVAFALIWIALYCVLSIPIRGKYGDESPQMLAALLAITAGLAVFLGKGKLLGRYGLTHWPLNSRRCLYFIPLWIIATGNLWSGIHLSYSGAALLFATISMSLIGYIEEIIFRGFLFEGMLRNDGAKAAIIVSSITFGIGHILNMFAGWTGLYSILDVIFAIAGGFIFTYVFYKSGSLLPGIIAHSLVDVFSKYGLLTDAGNLAYMIATIVLSIGYCVYLSRNVPTVLGMENKRRPVEQEE